MSTDPESTDANGAVVCVAARVCEIINEVWDDDDAVTLTGTLRDQGLLAPVCTSLPVARCFDCPVPRGNGDPR